MKIGLIDKYLDEWHANNLPTWLRDETDDIEEIYAYEMMPSPNDGGISGEQIHGGAGRSAGSYSCSS